VLSGEDEPPRWDSARTQTFEADVVPAVRARYAEVRELTAVRRA